MVVLLCGDRREAISRPELDAADVLGVPRAVRGGHRGPQVHAPAVRSDAPVRRPRLRCATAKPEYRAAARNVSAVINFAKFREEKVAPSRLAGASRGDGAAVPRRAAQERRAQAADRAPERAKDSEKSRRRRLKPPIKRVKSELADNRRTASWPDKKRRRMLRRPSRAGAASPLRKLASAEAGALEAKIVHVDPERTATLKALTQKCAEAEALGEATAETRRRRRARWVRRSWRGTSRPRRPWRRLWRRTEEEERPRS